MKVVKKTGLVPVHSFRTGTVFGVKPGIARTMLAANECELVEIPSHVETEDNAAPVPKETPKPVVETADVPEDWEKMHHLKQIALAKSLKEDYEVPEGMRAVEYAAQVIREYEHAKDPDKSDETDVSDEAEPNEGEVE